MKRVLENSSSSPRDIMHAHEDSKAADQEGLYVSALSPCSSSYSSSSSCSASVVPLSFSPVPSCGLRWRYGESLMALGLRFTELDWKEVEERFNRLASIRNNRTEPVVKWSDFGLTVGMKQSAEIANEILRALRGRREWKDDITKNELEGFWVRMNDSCIHSRIRLFFDMCDRNMDGRITEMDMKQTILSSASANNLSVRHEEAEEQASLIMGMLDHDNRGYLQRFSSKEAYYQEFHTLDLLLIIRICSTEEPMSKAEIIFRSYWRRGWVILLWLIICMAIFAWKFIQYSNRTAFQVMGYCLSTAKGAAETLKLNMALILLPVCRNSITWLRKNRRLNSVIPFNDNINFHKVIAGGIVVGVILHGGTHLACDFPRISSSDSSTFQQTIGPEFGYHQPSYIEILTTTEVATGLAMVVLMSIAFTLATKWPRRQVAFTTKKTTWMYIAIPVLLYTGERIFRAIRSRTYEIEILKAILYPGKVLSLKLLKPEGFKHPFSLTSGPRDDYLSVHIRTLGDWSYQLYSLFQEKILTGAKEFPKIYIDGPYGAASQDYIKYDIVVLIGLGIGVTPFISIIKDVVNGAQKTQLDQVGSRECNIPNGPLKTYLYWVSREQNSFDWFRDVIQEISSKTNMKQSVIEMHNFLTSVYEEGDVRSALISVIQALHFARTGIDIVSKTPVWTHFARPDWFNVFSKLARRHRGARIGVFYCGPTALARELERLCTKFSTKTNTRFVFHKEHY
ncbi:Respiratory burst oxidase [Melia azedarach]|uniref:Respiratory burst oxidase n=1 Tax=Melia azedarach TaxID=155640 RepID=A0ACC1XR37_MELAZ|nr:Respiratory burst oxidase [Melia azedarach]